MNCPSCASGIATFAFWMPAAARAAPHWMLDVLCVGTLVPSVAQLVVSQLVISRWNLSRLKPAPSLNASANAYSTSRRPPFCHTSRCTGWMRSAFQVQKFVSLRSRLGVTLMTPSPFASMSTVMPVLSRELNRYVFVDRNQLLWL